MENWSKTVLCLYDYTGTFSNVYRAAGFNVVQIDLAFNGKDVRLMKKLNADVYGIIAMPPCTKLSKAGSWIQREDHELIDALSMVDVVFRLVHLYKPVFWVLENPPGKLKDYLGAAKRIVRYQDCGAGFAKEACLWGDFNFPRLPRRSGKLPGVDSFSSSEKIRRSATPLGFAQLFFNYNH
jgi:hypothetical protein